MWPRKNRCRSPFNTRCRRIARCRCRCSIRITSVSGRSWPSAARAKGDNIERWDGLDDAGLPLPAGKYTWRGVYHQPITTKFVLSAHNSGTPPYATDDGTGGWGADHGPSMTACATTDGMLLGWIGCELGWGVIKTDLSGKKIWGIKCDARHLASAGQHFYLADWLSTDSCYGVRIFDVKDGRPILFQNGQAILAPRRAARATTINPRASRCVTASCT